MTELVITRGLPASGKTSFARRWVEGSAENRARVNRDDLRHTMFGVYWGLTHWQEEAVTAAQHNAVRGLLKAQISVIVDDTNLRLAHARAFADIAAELGVGVRVVEMTDVSVDLCVERDYARGREGERAVGEDVIRKMAARYAIGKRALEPVVASTPVPVEKYVPDPELPRAWLVDIDGTLAHMHDRGPFEWEKVGNDKLNQAVADVVTAVGALDEIVVMSGRDGSCRPQTEAWLHEHEIYWDLLLMRPVGDNRKDAIVKQELFWQHVAPNYAVQGVLDDRQQVVDAWRAMGLVCLQVAPGDF